MGEITHFANYRDILILHCFRLLKGGSCQVPLILYSMKIQQKDINLYNAFFFLLYFPLVVYKTFSAGNKNGKLWVVAHDYPQSSREHEMD